jgi:hypothetical protein
VAPAPVAAHGLLVVPENDQLLVYK